MDTPTVSKPRALRASRALACATATVITAMLGFAAMPLAAADGADATRAATSSAAGTQAATVVEALQPGLAGTVRQLALAGSRSGASAGHRVEVVLGQLDARLRLAPCQRIEPYLPNVPNGAALWGKTRIGLRCTQGTSAWNVFLPVTVNVFGKAWVAAAPLSAGATLKAGDLVQAEVNLAEETGAAITDADAALGRTLGRALNPGQALRQTDLKARQWFAAGDEVKVAARGSGFSVAGSGQALNHGLEGQPVRVRVESGRVLVGMPVGERLVELPL
ncbi:MAG: hypothetical protein AD742_03200 [Methylibium sp. NZG]|nr:MAG: hypothetical protein AD742_03200 [Methylibium sp. NZG]